MFVDEAFCLFRTVTTRPFCFFWRDLFRLFPIFKICLVATPLTHAFTA